MIHNKQHLDQFLRAARFRSEQNRAALDLLLKAEIYGIAIGLLRQEIDTFVRLVYLESVDERTAASLLTQFVDGKRWSRGGRLIRDGEMIEIAKAPNEWVRIAYDFGCKLIHFSMLHECKSIDPFVRISSEDRQTIVGFLRSYHGYRDADIDLRRFVRFLPKVMNKISGKIENCCCRLSDRKNYLTEPACRNTARR
jgi:hypothetical protein